MEPLIKKNLVPNEVPDTADILARAEREAAGLSIGTTLFMKHYGVSSEAEYKKKRMAEGKIMHHAHIGWNSWEETAKGFQYIYDELTNKRGITLDRFGVALDWVMGVPETMRHKVMQGGSLVFKTPEEWEAVGQVVPIQPHFGDHMIGSLNSTENAKLALHAGVTTMGNIAQYYTYEYPGGLMSKEERVINMTTAIALMARFKDQGALIHSNLDDGFGAMFHDLANLCGWAMLERYIVEDLLGARLSHCFGNLFSDPILRIIFLMAMDVINTHRSPGSMLYGNTIDFSEDYNRNYAALCSFVLADTCGQMMVPTGHAVTPIPITEAIRIPSVDEIIQVHITANMLEEKAKHYQLYLDREKMEVQKERLVIGGQIFFERVLNGLDDMGIDIRNPNELFLALKAMGPATLEEHFGAGKKDSHAMRGRIPIKPTDIVWTIGQKKEQICRNIPGLEHSLDGVNAIVACTDVHEFGKEIVKAILLKAGMHVFDLGANVSPQELADAVIETGSSFILISTFNGIALTYAKDVLDCLKRNDLSACVIMGGLLNENKDGQALPVEVHEELTKLGIICSNQAEDIIDSIKQHV
ncbi:cobalamin-dependent protein [uncultured Megasphaera sp.]|uniref:cobalamin-dependent protein n=1 Tax=uncultured Megasphaera sp. TaxID=165188 RepID=UPI0026599033|nr:cobalamin-dependent protein [uncultured Megasphaera sp.]